MKLKSRQQENSEQTRLALLEAGQYLFMMFPLMKYHVMQGLLKGRFIITSVIKKPF
ncbi:hypothetical protein [Proteus sp. HMSC14B05]|uniref:hypothetical protein n=1 Tax=Proteus sp. HMSC14B05 TaxID=1581097 RepID=UPI000AE68768|nr:hypothetical protein [Proteus sp. HMSC14B05]